MDIRDLKVGDELICIDFDAYLDMDFGRKMKRSRIDLGTTLGEMAKETGLSAGYISGLENQRKRIKPSDVEKINDFFTKRGLIVDWQLLADEANIKPLEKLEIDLSKCFVNRIK